MMSETADFDIFELIDMVDRLTEVLDAETRMLDAGDLGEIQALIDEKAKLVTAVQQMSFLVASNPELIDDGSQESAVERQELFEAVQTMHAASAENERALKAKIRSTDRLIRAVVVAVSEQERNGEQAYTKLGMRGSPAPTDPNRQLNRVL